MNSYKIIYPYQSDRIHLAPNEYTGFDLCYDEIKQSGRNVKIFVILHLNSNTPYYLEMNSPTADISNKNPINEVIINVDTRDGVSEVLTGGPSNPIAPFEGDNKIISDANKTVDIFNNPMRQTDQSNSNSSQIIPSTGQIAYLQKKNELCEQKIENMGRRINVLEEELIRTKMKVDYISQLNIGKTNMTNLLSSSHQPLQAVEYINKQHDKQRDKQHDKQRDKQNDDEVCTIM
jgi:hypothetical protein